MARDPKKLGEEADRMIEALTKQSTGAPGEQPVVATAPAEPTAVAPEAITDGEGAGNPDVIATVESPKAADPDALSALRSEIQTANQRWQVLQGMVNKKDSEIEQLRMLLAQLSQAASASASAPEPQAKLVTAKDEEDFGSDMVDLCRRIAKEVSRSEVADAVAQLRVEVARLEKSIGGVSEATSQIAADTFDEALTRAVPDWQKINVSPEFTAWLSEEEGFSGNTKLDLLKEAYAAGNLPRTVKFFKAFKDTQVPTAAPEPKADEPVSNVTKFVAPGKSKSTATPQVDHGSTKVWGKADIQKLYSDKREGRITAEEFVKLERDLFKAQSEGRIAA